MTKFKKTIASFAGFAIALSMFAVVAAPVANAATIDDLLAQIANLTAQLNALKGTSSTVSFTFTRNLTIGSTGADVTALQTWLIGKGYSIPAGATGYFGTQTKMALSQYQAAKGIVPAVGYFGPITMARVASEMTVVVNPGNPSNPSNPTNPVTGLAGTDGTISDINQLSQYSSEEVGEGEEDVKVLGFEVEASNDGDIALRSIKLRFDPTGNPASEHLDDFIDGVTVWQGDKKIGSAEVDDFNEESNDTYTKTITLSGSVVEADETEKFYVSVDGANNFDSSDIASGADWTIAIDSLRFEDGSGVVTTETVAIDTAIDWGALGDGVAIEFVSFSSAADTEFKVSKSSDTPTAHIVTIEESDNTDNVSLLKGKIKLEGTSDVVLDEFPVTLTTVGGANVAAVTGSVTLKIGSEEYTESVSITGATTGTVTFDNLDFAIDGEATVNFEVLADINDIDTGNLDEGDTLKAEVTATNNDYIDVENEEGDQLTDDTEKTGTALGNAQEFRTTGLQLAIVDADNFTLTPGNSANDDLGTFKIKFKVAANGDTIYMSSVVDSDGSLTGSENDFQTDFIVDRGGTATVGGVNGTLTMITEDDSDDDLTSVGNYTIEDGEEREFELIVTVQLPAAGSSGQYRVSLSDIPWAITDITTYNEYTSNLGAFKTPYEGLN